MSLLTHKKQITLIFPSAAAIAQFKQEPFCCDFYIERDAMAVVGFFTEEQIQLALKKYDARFDTMDE